jgi:1-acyl-sn-glycerol-3-phosphate acyltransferase
MKTFISLIKTIKAFFCVLKTAILTKIDTKNELKYRKECAKYVTDILTTKVEVVGTINPKAQILIGNHTTNFDIPLMESITDEKLIWVAKKELAQMPIFKWLLTETGMILVDRENKSGIIKLIKDIKKSLNKGKIVLFPEGTRNKKDPKKMLRWKKGPKAVIEKLNLQVQPFVIINMPYVMQNGIISPKKVKVIFLDIVDTSKENWYEETYKKLNQILREEYNEI